MSSTLVESQNVSAQYINAICSDVNCSPTFQRFPEFLQIFWYFSDLSPIAFYI